MIVLAAFRGIGTPVPVGTCCCDPTIYASVQMVFHHPAGEPAKPITSAELTLFIYPQTGTHANDVTFEVDISPISGLSVYDVWNQDWSFNLLLNGQPVGRVIYHYVPETGSSISNFKVNLTVYYNGYIYRAENCNATEYPFTGLTVNRTACTAAPAPNP